MGWLCSIQHQTVKKMGWEFRPPLSSVWFFCDAQGAALGAQLRPGVPGPGTPRSGGPGPAHSRGRGRRSHRRIRGPGAAVEVSGCQRAPRPRGGRPAPAWNVFIGIREPPASPPLVQAIAERHLSIFCQASWPLIAKFIWFKAASGEAGRENLSSVIGWPR